MPVIPFPSPNEVLDSFVASRFLLPCIEQRIPFFSNSPVREIDSLQSDSWSFPCAFARISNLLPVFISFLAIKATYNQRDADLRIACVSYFVISQKQSNINLATISWEYFVWNGR